MRWGSKFFFLLSRSALCSFLHRAFESPARVLFFTSVPLAGSLTNYQTSATMNLKQFQNHQPNLNNARPSIKILSQNPILPPMTKYAGWIPSLKQLHLFQIFALILPEPHSSWTGRLFSAFRWTSPQLLGANCSKLMIKARPWTLLTL